MKLREFKIPKRGLIIRIYSSKTINMTKDFIDKHNGSRLPEAKFFINEDNPLLFGIQFVSSDGYKISCAGGSKNPTVISPRKFISSARLKNGIYKVKQKQGDILIMEPEERE